MKKNDFLEYVENFLTDTEMRSSTFGRKALGRSDFVLKLRKGQEAREETQEKVFAFVKQYKKEHR